MLRDPSPPQFIGVEEPENFLHHRLLPELAEECRAATERSQLLVTTHSPFFINGLKPEEVRVLYRDTDGYTQAVRAVDLKGITEFIRTGAGIGLLPDFAVSEDLAAGRLVQLLPAWDEADVRPVSAIFPSRDGRPARVKLLIDFLQKSFVRSN